MGIETEITQMYNYIVKMESKLNRIEDMLEVYDGVLRDILKQLNQSQPKDRQDKEKRIKDSLDEASYWG